MRKKDFHAHDVYWYLPNRKTPFYYTTKYAKDYIHAMAKLYIKENNSSPTIEQLRYCFNFLCEETMLLDELIKRGYGQELYLKLFY